MASITAISRGGWTRKAREHELYLLHPTKHLETLPRSSGTLGNTSNTQLPTL